MLAARTKILPRMNSYTYFQMLMFMRVNTCFALNIIVAVVISYMCVAGECKLKSQT